MPGPPGWSRSSCFAGRRGSTPGSGVAGGSALPLTTPGYLHRGLDALFEEFSKGTRFGGRIAHGALLVGFVLTAFYLGDVGAQAGDFLLALGQLLLDTKPLAVSGDRIRAERVCEVSEQFGGAVWTGQGCSDRRLSGVGVQVTAGR